MLAPRLCEAQGEQAARPVDSIAVVGVRRQTRQEVIEASGLVTGQPFSYRDVQRAIRSLYATGQFDVVQMDEVAVAGRRLLVVTVRERPTLVRWSLRGAVRVPEGKLKEKAKLIEGR